MFISPVTALNQGWLRCINPEINIQEYIQPNAIDIDCVRIFEIDTQSSSGMLGINSKVMCQQTELFSDKKWVLERGRVYDFVSNFDVSLPKGVACYLITRSTLIRNGVQVISGLYDSGFNGSVGGVIDVKGHAGTFSVEPGARVCQLIFVESQDSGILYAGGYNTQSGQHWSEKQ